MKTTEFWKGKDGDEYTYRNEDFSISANLAFFSEALKHMGPISDIKEYGCNIGLNLIALDMLYPTVDIYGADINESALDYLARHNSKITVIKEDITGPGWDNLCDLVFTKGVLIHVDPNELKAAYKKLYETSAQYILIAEYYNPTPVMIPYRGKDNLLWKRDFAGEMMDMYPDLKLLDYGFWYRRDKHRQDDITYFLMEKGE